MTYTQRPGMVPDTNPEDANVTSSLDLYRDLVERLRSLANFEDDRSTICDEAADLIQQLLDEIDTIQIQSQPDVLNGWVCIPEEEWEQVMRRVWG